MAIVGDPRGQVIRRRAPGDDGRPAERPGDGPGEHQRPQEHQEPREAQKPEDGEALLAAPVFVASAQAASEVVLANDFEDGTAQGWFARGGSVAVSARHVVPSQLHIAESRSATPAPDTCRASPINRTRPVVES